MFLLFVLLLVKPEKCVLLTTFGGEDIKDLSPLHRFLFFVSDGIASRGGRSGDRPVAAAGRLRCGSGYPVGDRAPRPVFADWLQVM